MTSARPFFYRGRIPASKSIMNRLLILSSFESGLAIVGDSDADDVLRMKLALAQLARGEVADCGAAGTTLRFLALRASRIPGTHHLAGSLRLFQRPQGELARLLRQLGCEAEMGPQRLTIRGQGWKIPDEGVNIDRSVSSQFVSALVLSAWDLPQPLQLKMSGEVVSESYFKMTLELARRAGMDFSTTENTVTIRERCHIRPQVIEAESDLSSAFAIAALAAVSGEAIIEGWPAQSLQPDAVFADLLKEMGCVVEASPLDESSVAATPSLRVLKPTQALRPLHFNLREAPDLFPVLGVLCAVAEGRSRLHGAPQLAHKESSRIDKTAELIGLMGRKCRILEDGLEIDGHAMVSTMSKSRFDTDHDHRLAFAAAVAQAVGAPIEILHPEVVSKSFPEFWDLARGSRT